MLVFGSVLAGVHQTSIMFCMASIRLLQYVHHSVVIMEVGVGVGVREGIHVSKNQVSPGPFS